ncbi:MAG: DUF115 domain-containing protein, partial [Leptonema sp. (in: Bacteria)]|nr:DUF115 domain-containing protein [Leptonema sp. (in: bacteria)]
VNQNTLQRFDKLWLKNIYYNLKHYQRFKPLNQLLKNHTTKPVVIVSAGPSLNQSLPLLKEYRQQVVIVAVDTAIHVLNTFGIDADFLLSVDAQSANFLHLRNYQGKARLIIDITVSYLTMRHLHGFYYLFANPLPAANFFLKKIFNADLAELQFGGSVSTNAFDFTLQLKPASIYFCGLDLSFVNKQIHAKGSALEEASLSKTNRLLSPQLQNYRQITAIDRRYLKNKSGKLVPTNDKLLLFYNWYISQFSKLQNDSTTPKLYIVDGQGAYFQKVETISISNFEQQLKLVENQLQSIDSNTILDQPIFEFNTLLDSINDRLDSMLTLLNKPPSPDLALHLLHEDNQSKLPILKLLSAGMQNQLNQNFNNLTNNELAAFFQGLQANCLLHKKLIQRLL